MRTAALILAALALFAGCERQPGKSQYVVQIKAYAYRYTFKHSSPNGEVIDSVRNGVRPLNFQYVAHTGDVAYLIMDQAHGYHHILNAALYVDGKKVAADTSVNRIELKWVLK